MKMKLGSNLRLFYLLFAVVVLLNFGKLVWVHYFSATRNEQDASLLDSIFSVIPAFLVLVIIAVCIGFLRKN